ncbi:MAG: helix-turn-helix domain-containing protein [Acidimicrobiales bacterium]
MPTIHWSPPPGVHPQGSSLVMTVEEAGRALGISRALAYELVARHELPFLRLGRRIVIPRTAIAALVNRAGDAASSTQWPGTSAAG